MDTQAIVLSIFDPNSPFLISMPLLWRVIQVMFLIAGALYIVYALVIVRQISLMSRTVSTLLEPLVKILGWVHLLASLFVWFLIFMLKI